MDWLQVVELLFTVKAVTRNRPETKSNTRTDFVIGEHTLKRIWKNQALEIRFSNLWNLIRNFSNKSLFRQIVTCYKQGEPLVIIFFFILDVECIAWSYLK